MKFADERTLNIFLLIRNEVGLVNENYIETYNSTADFIDSTIIFYISFIIILIRIPFHLRNVREMLKRVICIFCIKAEIFTYIFYKIHPDISC